MIMFNDVPSPIPRYLLRNNVNNVFISFDGFLMKKTYMEKISSQLLICYASCMIICSMEMTEVNMQKSLKKIISAWLGYLPKL